MLTWAKIIYGILSLFREIGNFIHEQKLLAQGRKERDEELLEIENDRIREANLARNRTDADLGLPVEKDPFNRDNRK